MKKRWKKVHRQKKKKSTKDLKKASNIGEMRDCTCPPEKGNHRIGSVVTEEKKEKSQETHARRKKKKGGRKKR